MNKIALAGLATAAPSFAPSAAVDVPGLSPFVGSWHAHEEGLDLQPDGNGHETYADTSTCPDAPAAGCGKTGTVDFTLTSVSGDIATGAITVGLRRFYVGRRAKPLFTGLRLRSSDQNRARGFVPALCSLGL